MSIILLPPFIDMHRFEVFDKGMILNSIASIDVTVLIDLDQGIKLCIDNTCDGMLKSLSFKLTGDSLTTSYVLSSSVLARERIKAYNVYSWG